MSTYLIDFENVKSGGLTGIDSIRKEDSVHLFWSTRENKISIEMMELIRSSESEIVMHKAVTGERDALDHQLCSYLGFLAGAQGETDFVIVSNDKAYDHLIEFWKKMNDTVKISRVSDISKAVEALRRQEAAKEAARRAAEKEAEKAAEKDAAKVQAEISVQEAVPVLDTAAEKTENTVKEAAAEEPRHGRNARRRERGGRYLKNGRQGRGDRRNTYTEEAVPAQVKEQSVYEAEVKAAQPAEEKSVISPAAYVVSGITSGILVESGYTADGILDKREEKQPEPVKVEAPVELQPADEAEIPVKEEVSQDIPVKKQEEEAAEKPEEPAKVQEEPETESQEEPVKVQEEPEAESQEEPVKVQEEPEAEKQEEPSAEQEKPEAEQLEEADEVQEESAAELEVPFEEKSDKIEKKARSKSSKTAGRTRKSRTAKTKEHTPKAPATAADVEEKCEEAAHAEWTADVVRLINESKDLKELYASIVKLLGQENGRKVYRAIKVLK